MKRQHQLPIVMFGMLLASNLIAQQLEIQGPIEIEQPISVNPGYKTLQSENGRYVLGQISTARADQFLLDTQTGEIWQRCTTTEGVPVLQQVFYSAKGGYFKTPDLANRYEQFLRETEFARKREQSAEQKLPWELFSSPDGDKEFDPDEYLKTKSNTNITEATDGFGGDDATPSPANTESPTLTEVFYDPFAAPLEEKKQSDQSGSKKPNMQKTLKE